MSRPDVCVVIPAYNAAAFLAAALQSVANQSVQPSQVIVVDDGSADATCAIAKSFGATVIVCTNAGPSAARNVGLAAARATYVAFLDADDLWLPEKLGRQLDALTVFGSPAFSFCDYRLFDSKGMHRSTSVLRRTTAFRAVAGNMRGRDVISITNDKHEPVLRESFVVPSLCVVRRADALQVGGFDETLRACEDYEFLLRLFRLVPAVVVMQALVCYRLHPDQATALRPTAMRAAYADVAARLVAAPERYRVADARYIVRNGYWRDYKTGIGHLRAAQPELAAGYFKRSLVARPSARAAAALAVAQLSASPVGRRAFTLLRTLWKQRPKRR